MERGKKFFFRGYVWQAIWAVIVLGISLLPGVNLWTDSIGLVFFTLASLLVVGLMVNGYQGVNGASVNGENHADTSERLLYGAAVILLVSLWVSIHFTGGLDASPFAFYYLHIPYVIALTFFRPIDQKNISKMQILLKSPGGLPTLIIATICTTLVALHILLPPTWQEPEDSLSLWIYRGLKVFTFILPLTLSLLMFLDHYREEQQMTGSEQEEKSK